MSDKLRDEIITVRDYLYEMAGQYVDKVAETARRTKKKPKIRYDYLKTSNEYATFEMALDAARKWHENLAENLAKLNKSKEMFEKSLVGAVHVMDLVDGLSVYQLTTEEALDFESEYMGHCVGKGSYDKGVKDGSIKIYSIRDEHGEPHCTLDVRGSDIMQIKGKQNKAPIHKYVPAIKMFIEQTKLNPKHDLKNLRLIKQDNKLYDIFNLPKDFVVAGDLDLSRMELEKLPDLSTITVKGAFICSDNKLTDLKGIPKFIGGNFDCSRNQLTSLEGAPKSVEGYFLCGGNKLTNLKGAPKTVMNSFDCSHNEIVSLDGAPKSISSVFDCSYNKLTSLKGLPKFIGGHIDCSGNQLITLEGAPRSVTGDFDCSDNQLTSLKGAPIIIKGDKTGAFPGKTGDFICSENQLVDLSGAPVFVRGSFLCSKNQLVSLKGAPKIVGDEFRCSANQLVNLKGAPKLVAGDFDCSDNKLTSLDGAPRAVGGTFVCIDNKLTNLIGAPNVFHSFFGCSRNPLTSLVGLPKKTEEFHIDYNDSMMAPEYIRDIKSDLTDEQEEIMIRNYQKYKSGTFKSFVKRMLGRQDSMHAQENFERD